MVKIPCNFGSNFTTQKHFWLKHSICCSALVAWAQIFVFLDMLKLWPKKFSKICEVKWRIFWNISSCRSKNPPPPVPWKLSMFKFLIMFASGSTMTEASRWGTFPEWGVGLSWGKPLILGMPSTLGLCPKERQAGGPLCLLSPQGFGSFDCNTEVLLILPCNVFCKCKVLLSPKERLHGKQEEFHQIGGNWWARSDRPFCPTQLVGRPEMSWVTCWKRNTSCITFGLAVKSAIRDFLFTFSCQMNKKKALVI